MNCYYYIAVTISSSSLSSLLLLLLLLYFYYYYYSLDVLSSDATRHSRSSRATWESRLRRSMHACNENNRNIMSLPPRHGGLGIVNPCTEACLEYLSSIKVTSSLVEKIISQTHELPKVDNVKSAKQEARNDRQNAAKDKLRKVKDTLPKTSSRALDLAAEKGVSTWLAVILLQEMGFSINKREFRDALRLRYNWPFSNIPSKFACVVKSTLLNTQWFVNVEDSLYSAMMNYGVSRPSSWVQSVT